MKNKIQKSGFKLVAQLIKKLQAEVDSNINEGGNSRLIDSLKAELNNILYKLDKLHRDGSSDTTDIYSNLQEKIFQAEGINQLELSTDTIWLIDTSYNIILANNNFKNNFKLLYNNEPRIGTNIIDILPPDYKKKWKDRFAKALSGKQLKVIDKYEVNSKVIFAETILNPLSNENEIIGVSCIAKNITDKKLTEIALVKSEERYKTILSNIPSVFYRYKYDKDFTMELISDEIERVSGYPPEQFIENKIRSYTSIIHPGDREFVKNVVSECILLNKTFELEYRLIHADGNIRWVHERGRVHYSDKGDILCIDGFLNDITKRKDAEEALRQSEEKYRHIFLSISDLFIKTDENGIITLVTPSVENILGYKADEVIGKALSSYLKFPGDYAQLMDKLTKLGTVKEFETILVSKLREEITISLNARTILDKNYNLIGLEGIARDISERKIAEQNLRARTKELYSIFDNTPVILILADESGEIININQATSRFGSKKHQEILNQLSTEAIKCIHATQSSKGCGKGNICNNCVVRKTFAKTVKEKRNFHQVAGKMKVHINNEDIERQVLLSTTYIDFEDSHRVLLNLDDITELSTTQEQLRKLSVAMQQSTATIVITDANGEIEYANPQFEKSTGYTVKEAIGKNPRILKSPKTNPEVYKDLWKTILSGKTWQGEFLNVKRDGTEYWENAIISPIFNDSGKITSFIAVKEDITERKRIQEELIRSEKVLRQLNDEKSQFISILAHDLRGHVGAFYGYTNLLLTEFDNFSKEEIQEQLHILVKSSKDSLTLLDNLLEWGRASLGSLAISLTGLNLYSEVKSIIDYLFDLAKSKGIKITFNIDREINIVTDKNIINTIIRNLIGNAIKFTPSGGEITVFATIIPDDFIEISVKDSGIGMDSNIKNKLFKAGEKIVKPGTNNEKGTGLGLMICHEMVNRLGGSIYVESELGKGSRFYFRLPLKENIE